MQAGDDQRGVHKAEHGAEDDAERARDAGIHGGRNRGADGPADGAEHEVGGHDRQHQAAEGHHDHRDDGGADLAEELFQVHQGEGRQHGGNDLGLVADHVDLDEAEVPLGDVGGGGGGHRVGVQQLAGHQGQAQDDAQALGGAHLFGHRPADADRQHVEDGLTDQPQEAVHAAPELADLHQGLGAVFQQVHAVDTVAEAQDQAAGDHDGDQRGEDLGQGAHDLLGAVLVLLGRALDGVLRDALDARHGHEIVVKVADRVADDDLELAGLGKGALGRPDLFDAGHVCFGRIVQHKAHPGDAVRYRSDVFFAADCREQFFGVLYVFTHETSSFN